MAKEFIVYAQTKASFEAQVASGDVDSTQIGIIAETGELWTAGNYHPLVERTAFAKDLTGVIEATPEEFTFRPSAGDKSIRDESAVIRRIKGNTVVFAQLSKHTDTLQREDDWSVAPEVTTNTWGVFSSSVQVIANHKYLFYINKKDGRSITDTYTLLKGAYRVDFDTPLFITSTETASWTWTARYQTSTNGLRFQTQAFDLTNLFGEGNEPSTLEEFKRNYPDIYPYCEPEIRNMRAWGIETVSANAFDKDSAVAGVVNADGTIADNANYSLAKIEVVPNERYSLHNVANTFFDRISCSCALYDSNDKVVSIIEIRDTTTTNKAATGDVDIPINARYMSVVVHNDYLDSCCVNLKHSGTFGDDTTYFRKVRELPEIANYFPDGMSGVGEVYDEINAENAIQRCGVRAYEDGDENNPNVMTDRTNTVYQLAEPIVTPITEPLQLDYEVADFGTEKALAAPKSSPFRADIVYQFNAEGRIRDNGRNIAKLETKVNTLDRAITVANGRFDEGYVKAEGIIDAAENLYLLPSSSSTEKDKRLANEQYVIDSLPREVAQAVERIVGSSIPQQLSPNIIYEATGSILGLKIVSLNGQKDSYDDVWRVRCGLDGNATIDILPTRVLWENGIAPNPTEWGIYEFEFRKTQSLDNRILGRWRVYK